MPSGAYTELDKLLRSRFLAQTISLFPKGTVRSRLSGNERTRFRGRGMDFEEVRLYQAGDDIRSIDWRVTARTQVTHTKVYREERERPVLILVDQRSSMFFGSRQCFKSVLAAEIAATLAWAALARGDRIGGQVQGDNQQRDIKPRRSKHSVLEFLHQIQDFNHQLTTPVTRTSQDVNPLIHHARRLAKPGSAVFIISDFYGLSEQDLPHLYELVRHTDVKLIQVYDPLEKHLASAADLSISNGDKQILLPAYNKQFQSAFEHAFVQRQEKLQNLCKQMRIGLLSFSTADNFTNKMHQYFGNAKYDPTLTLPLPGEGTAPPPGKGEAGRGSGNLKKGFTHAN